MAQPTPDPARKPSAAIIYAVIGLLSLIWGSTYFVIRTGLEDLPPFTSVAIRFALAFVAMSGLALVLARKEGGRRPPFWLSLVLGLCNFGVSYGIVYWSETILPSGLVSVLWAVFPIFMAMGAHLFVPGERLRARQWSGFLVGFAGVVLLFSIDLRSIGPEAVTAGFVLLLSPAITATGQTMVKRHGAHVSSLLLNRNGMLISALFLGTVALLFEHDVDIRWTRQAIFSIVYLSMVGTVTTFGLFFWALRYAPAYLLSVISYLSPALALTLGAVLGGEPVGVQTVLGLIAILSGVGMVMISSRSRARATSEPPRAAESP